jgi:superfamily II DNA/RNA helicase
MTFAELGIPPDLVAALAKQNITEPTPIQVAALPVLLDGHDAYLNAETGTGKTLAYLLPIFCRLQLEQKVTQALIVAPTHELAIQIHRQCGTLAQNAGRAIRALLMIGGTSMDRQLDKLKQKPHLVVGSPGRIRDLIGMGKLKTAGVRTVVMDEADRLLDEESLPALRQILRATPKGTHSVFASATEQPASAAAIAALAPGVLMLRAGSAAVNANIEHLYLVCEERDKPKVLRQLLHALLPERALVFAHVNVRAGEIVEHLEHHGIPTVELHAAFDKRDRQRAMEEFRSGEVRVMVASDVAARGLDLPGVTHIFNLDVPTQSKAYLHRVGRTARAGASGTAITLMTEIEVRRVRRYETELGIALRQVRMREGRVIDAAERGGDFGEPRADQPARPGPRPRPATKRA